MTLEKPAKRPRSAMLTELTKFILPIIDVPPPPEPEIDPMLGKPIHRIEIAWQDIVEGMKDHGLAVRVYTVSDRSILYRTAERLGLKIFSRHSEVVRPAAAGGTVSCWIAQVVNIETGSKASRAAALDVLVPSSRGTRGYYRSLAVVALERGTLAIADATTADCVHRSLRRFIWRKQLSPKRQHHAVTLTQSAETKEWIVEVTPAVQAAYRAKTGGRTEK